jgi:hypothetical protein
MFAQPDRRSRARLSVSILRNFLEADLGTGMVKTPVCVIDWVKSLEQR